MPSRETLATFIESQSASKSLFFLLLSPSTDVVLAALVLQGWMEIRKLPFSALFPRDFVLRDLGSLASPPANDLLLLAVQIENVNFNEMRESSFTPSDLCPS